MDSKFLKVSLVGLLSVSSVCFSSGKEKGVKDLGSTSSSSSSSSSSLESGSLDLL
ncbi:hypothetical protein AGMMS49949_09380 [Alphaproteobacteria bacterium]|nr:hypothetical protein AGMMS49949_09380 [Alphaproteobacteria bacterium]GHT00562.1 hypothetical protein AGMMS50296_8900 [Alphaproteobacteria bacterium]